MKRFLLLVTILTLILTGVSAQTIIQAQIDRSQYRVGDSVTVLVNVSGNTGSGVHGLYFDLAYDSGVLRFDSLRKGGLVSSETRPASFFWAQTNAQTSQRLGSRVVLSYALGGSGNAFVANGNVAELNFTVVGSGPDASTYGFNFLETGVIDSVGNPVSGSQWKNSPLFTIKNIASTAYMVLSAPTANQVVYTPTIALNGVYTASDSNSVVLANLDGNYSSAPISGSSGILSGNNVPLVYGFNRLSAQLLNAQGQILAKDSVTVYRSEGDKYVRILSPGDHELLSSDMVNVRVSAPQGHTVTVNGLSGFSQGDLDGTNLVYTTRVWLREGFNTITAVSVSPVGASYSQSIMVYYRKDSSIFNFVTPLANQYFKPTDSTTLSVVGEIDSPFQSAPSVLGGAPQANVVTLKAVYFPANGKSGSRVLVDKQILVIKEASAGSSQHSAYQFSNDTPISLSNLQQGTIELTVYKNQTPTGSDAEIHRIINIDSDRLWINLLQPNVLMSDSLDSPSRFATFNESKLPVVLAGAMDNKRPDGTIALSASTPTVHTEQSVANTTKTDLTNMVDMAEMSDGSLYALASVNETIRIYHKATGETSWSLVLTRSGMFGYRLCPTNQGLLVGVSNMGGTNESGVFLLKDTSFINLQFPVSLKHVQFIENQNSTIYLYGNYFSKLYSFDINQLVSNSTGLAVARLDSLDMANNLSIKQFILAPSARTVVLRTDDNHVQFFQRNGSVFNPMNVGLSDPGDLVAQEIAAGFYEAGDYFCYVLLNDQSVTTVMEHRTRSGVYVVAQPILSAWLGIAVGDPWKALGIGFANNRFTFLYQEKGQPMSVNGQVYFNQFKPSDGNAISYPNTPALTLTVGPLLITRNDILLTGWGMSANGAGLPGPVNSLYTKYDTTEGQLGFNYVNDDVEGLTGFEFEVDTAWLDTLPADVKFSFSLKTRTSLGAITPQIDPTLLSVAYQPIKQLLGTSNNQYTITRSWDTATGLELIHIEFAQVQPKSYLQLIFGLTSPGDSTPVISGMRIFKKIHPTITSSSDKKPVILPIHGYIYDPTVSEIFIVGNQVALGRDGSFDYRLSIDPSVKILPVTLYCSNASGERADLNFTVEIIESRNAIGSLVFTSGKNSTPSPVDLTIAPTVADDQLNIQGEAFGLTGAVCGYEIWAFATVNGQESPKLISQGLLDTSPATDPQAVYSRLNNADPGAGYTALKIDSKISLIPGRQQIRLFTENPGGHRTDYLPNADSPDFAEITYSIPVGQQGIIFDFGDPISTTPVNGVNPQIKAGIPIKVVQTYHQTATEHTVNGGFVFNGNGEISGQILSLHQLDDLIVKSYTPGLVFANGLTETRITVQAGNRFSVAYSYTMGSEVNQKFYIGFVPTIPAMTSLASAVEIVADKNLDSTSYIPDFTALKNWTADQQKSMSIPLVFGFNRNDIPLASAGVADRLSLSVSLNFGDRIEGVVRATDATHYTVVDSKTGAPISLNTANGLKLGTNRLGWTLKFTYPGTNTTVTMASSSSGGMNDFLFNLISQGNTTVATIITFSTPLRPDIYYNATSLPTLQVTKDPLTSLQVSVNSQSLIITDPLHITLDAGVHEGKNDVVISYQEQGSSSPSSQSATFLYDSQLPQLSISSVKYNDDNQTLNQLIATVHEANFNQAWLFYGPNIIDKQPDILPLDSDTTILVWHLAGLNIQPTANASVSFKASDRSGKTSSSSPIAGLGGQAAHIANDNPLPDQLLTMPSYSDAPGNNPSLTNESNYQLGDFANHTKFAPSSYLRWQSTIDKIQENQNILVDNPTMQVVGTGLDIGVSTISLSPDGNLEALGLPYENSGIGCVYLFAKVDGIWSQPIKFVAPGGLANDHFGDMITLSGTSMIINVPKKTVSGVANVGAVYVYERTGATWASATLSILANPEPVANDNFGASIKLSGTSLIVAAPYQTVGGVASAGVVYIFDKVGPTWTEATRTILRNPEPVANDYFGGSIMFNDTSLIVRTPSKIVGGITNAGAVYVYEKTGSTWVGTTFTILANPSPVAGDRFGSSTILSGTSLIVTAPSKTVGGISSAGAVYVYEKNGSTWVASTFTTLANPSPVAGDGFGSSTILSGTSLIVTAPSKTVAGIASAGAVYVYDKTGATWENVLLTTLTNPVPVAKARFGNKIILDGTTLIVTAPSYSGALGGPTDAKAVYVYDKTGPTWAGATLTTLANPAPMGYDGFGYTITLSGTSLIVTAPYKTVGGKVNAGAVYVYDKTSSTWAGCTLTTLADPVPEASEVFGRSISLSGNSLIVKVDTKTVGGIANAGALYVYEKTGATWAGATLTTLANPAPVSYDSFGSSVTLNGTSLIVPAPGKSVGGVARVGSVYIYDKTGATWAGATLTTLTNPTPVADDLFGTLLTTINHTFIVASSKKAYLIQPKYYPDLQIPTPANYGKFLVFGVKKDTVITNKDLLDGKIQFQVVGTKQNISTLSTVQVYPSNGKIAFTPNQDSLDQPEAYYETADHVYYAVSVAALQAEATTQASLLFPPTGPGDGFQVTNWGQLQIQYQAVGGGQTRLISPDSIFFTGENSSTTGDLTFYDHRYEALPHDNTIAPTLDPSFTQDSNHQTWSNSFKNASTVTQKTWNFWFRPDDEDVTNKLYANSPRRPIFQIVDPTGQKLLGAYYTIGNSNGNPQFALESSPKYLNDIPNTPLVAFDWKDQATAPKVQWHMVSIQVINQAGAQGLQVFLDGHLVNNQPPTPILNVDLQYAGNLAGSFLAKDTTLSFGAGAGITGDTDTLNTGFFSIADARSVDRWLTSNELDRLYNLRDQNTGNGTQKYDFSASIADQDVVADHLRKTGAGSIANDENANYNEDSSNGSLLATRGQRNALVSTIQTQAQGDNGQAWSGSLHLVGANSWVLNSLAVPQADADRFTIQPLSGTTGRLSFGDRIGNYGLKTASSYCVSGTVQGIGNLGSARIYLRINGSEQSWPLAAGKFQFIYVNSSSLAPSDVALYIKTNTSLTLGTDLGLNEGNYRISTSLSPSAAHTFFPFDLAGSVQFWFKPFNTNQDGFVNEEGVLFDSEYLQIGTQLDSNHEACYYLVLRDGAQSHQTPLATSIKVQSGWHHLQVSYDSNSIIQGNQKLSFWIDGTLALVDQAGTISSMTGSRIKNPANGSYDDNVYLGSDLSRTNFAEGFIDNVVLEKYYRNSQFIANSPFYLSYNAATHLVLQSVVPSNQTSSDYTINTMQGQTVASGTSFPVDVSNLPAGRYRLMGSFKILDHNFSQTLAVTINDRPSFNLVDAPPIAFHNYSKGVSLGFAYDSSLSQTSVDQNYAGLAVHLKYNDSSNFPVDRYVYIAQDFINQNPADWIVASVAKEGDSKQWTGLTLTDRGWLQAIFDTVCSTSDIVIEYKTAYFMVDKWADVFASFAAIAGPIQQTKISLAKLTITPLTTTINYGLGIAVGDSQSYASNPIFADMSVQIQAVLTKTGMVSQKSFGLDASGHAMVFYDDLLPGFGDYQLTIALQYHGTTYATQTYPVSWNISQDDKPAVSTDASLNIREFSSLSLDKQTDTADFSFSYDCNSVQDLNAFLDIFQNNQQWNKDPIPFGELVNVGGPQRAFKFGVAVPKGDFTVRLSLKAQTDNGGLVRSQTTDLSNDSSAPDVYFTNSVESLIAYNTVFFSWKGYYQGSFNDQILYQYNFDNSGWTSANKDWRSVRFYSLTNGSHNMQIKAVYNGKESVIHSMPFFVDVSPPIFDKTPAMITVQKRYDPAGVFYAVDVVGQAKAISDDSLNGVSINDQAISWKADGSFSASNIPITVDGSNKLRITAVDRVGNQSDYWLNVDNSLTNILFPQTRVRYMPLTVVGQVTTGLPSDVAIYVADSTTTIKGAADFSTWKKAKINEDRTFMVEDVAVNPGTDSREILTTLRLATVFHPDNPASMVVFQRNLDVYANQVFMPIELTLSSHAMAGANIASQVNISAKANVPNIAAWSVDFDGNGIYDLIETVDNPAIASAQTRSWDHRYSSLGQIQPRVRVLTTDGQFFSVSDSLIIHERITEASNKSVPGALAMSVLNNPDTSKTVYILRQDTTNLVIESYEIPSDDAYLSTVLSSINLTSLGIHGATRLAVIDATHLVVAANNNGNGSLYLLASNAYGNFLVETELDMPGEVRDLAVGSHALSITLVGDPAIITLPLTSDQSFDSAHLATKTIDVPGSGPIGARDGIAYDTQGLLVADFFNQRVVRLSPSLAAVEQFGSFGNGEGQFIKPSLIKSFENRIYVYDEARHDIQVFDSNNHAVCTLRYDPADPNNYLEPDSLNAVADLAIVTKAEGAKLYYYALILSQTKAKVSLIRLPQWEELRAQVRNNKIAFLKDKEIFTAKPDGSDLSKLLTSDSLPPIEGLLNYPAVSPDGRRVVFVAKAPLFHTQGPQAQAVISAGGYNYLYFCDIDNKVVTYLELPGLKGYRIERPEFNSNGDKIIFSARPETGKWQIYVYELATGLISQLFNSDENARFPYYSPDDRFVAFTTDYSGNEEIEIIDTQNTSLRVTLTANQARDSLPVWSTVYPQEISNPDLKVESKITFVSERNFHKGIYVSYLTRNSDTDLRVFDLKHKTETGSDPDQAALELTTPGIEGDYPCFTGDAKSVIFETSDGTRLSLKRFAFDKYLNTLLIGTGTVVLDAMDILSGASHAAGMKNMISGFKAQVVDGNNIQLAWARYTDNDIFYHVYFRKNLAGQNYIDKKVSSQTGALLTGLEMGQEYLVRVAIVENGAEVASSQWQKVSIAEVAAKPSFSIDAANPYVVHLHAWKPLPETKWKFSWLIENQEIPVQASQDFSYEYATSGNKTITLKVATLGDSATAISSPLTVPIASDIVPVIQYALDENTSYIELSALNSTGSKIDWANTVWTISGPGHDQVVMTGAKPIMPLTGFQRKINVALQLKRIVVNGQTATDSIQKTITINLDMEDVKPVIVYQCNPDDRQLVSFSGEYSTGNIDWYRASWAVYADNGLIASKDGVSTFSYRFPDTGKPVTYSVSLTLPRRNDGMTETTNQIVTIAAAPMEPQIDYQVLDLIQGVNVVGEKLVLDATKSKGSDIDFTQARWTLPSAGAYGESPTQIGPTAVYNLQGVAADTVMTVSLTLSRRGGTDVLSITKLIRIRSGELAIPRLVVNQALAVTSTGNTVSLDVLKSTGPNIEWDKTQWNIDGVIINGPLARYPVPASSTKPSIHYSVTLYASGQPLIQNGEVQGLFSATIRPDICEESRTVVNGETVVELSALHSEGVNIDWERTLWSIYDGSDTVQQVRGSSIVHSFKPQGAKLGYPIMIEMYFKDGSQPFIGYKSIDINADTMVPIITSAQAGSDPATIVFSATSSRGSGIQWGNAKWSFGDSSEVQYGQTATHKYAVDGKAHSFLVSLTLSRGTGDSTETLTTTKQVNLGVDTIKPKITATRMGDTLVLSAEDSLGTGLQLDRSVWVFTGAGDASSASSSSSTNIGVTTTSHLDFNVGARLTIASGLLIPNLSLEVSAGSDFGWGWQDTTTKDTSNSTNYSSENQHIGAICRRSVGNQSTVQVTLMVYRATSTGALEGESITANVSTSGGTYGGN